MELTLPFKSAAVASAIGAGTLLLVTPQKVEAATVPMKLQGAAVFTQATGVYSNLLNLPITFEQVINPLVIDIVANPTSGSYPGAITSASFNVDNDAYVFSNGMSLGQAQTNNTFSSDQFATFVFAPAIIAGSITSPDGIAVIFETSGINNPTVLSSDQLTSAMDSSLSDFNERYIYFVSGDDSFARAELLDGNYSLMPVPTPNTTVVLVVSLGLLAHRRRREPKTQPQPALD